MKTKKKTRSVVQNQLRTNNIHLYAVLHTKQSHNNNHSKLFIQNEIIKMKRVFDTDKPKRI